ncbi:MAG: hypothetical protein ABIL58_23290 [Pseudomonadota bacterium]
MNRLRTVALRMVKTPFREPWQFRIEVEGFTDSSDFDLYVKDISYGPIEIEIDPVRAGMQQLAFPSGAAPVSITMTMRDHEDRRVSNWFAARASKVVNPDGTVNLPAEYILKIRRYSLLHDGGEAETDVWEVVPIRLGDVTEARDAEGALEFPIAFVQFRS